MIWGRSITVRLYRRMFRRQDLAPKPEVKAYRKLLKEKRRQLRKSQVAYGMTTSECRQIMRKWKRAN